MGPHRQPEERPDFVSSKFTKFLGSLLKHKMTPATAELRHVHQMGGTSFSSSCLNR